MKIFKRIAVACAALMLLSSCSVLQSVVTNGTALGANTGSGLAAIVNVLKATNKIDLSNLTNIINIGKILTGASSLSGATNDFMNDFVAGLMSGSDNLVNSSNISSVITGLQSLSNIDTSVLSAAAAAAATGQAAQVSNSNEGVAATLNVLKNLASVLK